MIIFAPSTLNAAQAARYYLGELGTSRAGYYLEPESHGRWGGKGSQRLELKGPVSRDAFGRLTRNLHPKTNKRLTPRTKRERRVGQDISFHVPKSVSVLWAMNRDPKIVTAIRQAAEDTLHLMEERTAARVRKGGADEDRFTGELTWASFTHMTARPSKDHPTPDPLLHVHAFVFNHTFDPVDDHYKAVQLGLIREETPFYQAVFHSQVSKSISDLGYGLSRTGDMGYEVTAVTPGVNPGVARRFSSRTREIEAKAKELGITDPTQKSTLGARTRRAKAKNLTLEQLRGRWKAMLKPKEWLTIRQAKKIEGDTPLMSRDCTTYAIDHSFERDAVVRRRQLLTDALKHGMGSVSLAQIEDSLNTNPWLGYTDELKREFLTTRQLLDEERDLLAFVRKGKHTREPLGDPRKIDRQVDGLELNDQQLAAVHAVVDSRNRVEVLTGSAGVGKTMLFKAIRKSVESKGRSILALAPTAEASRGVLRDVGFTNAETVAKFLQDEKLQEQYFRGVIWVDEASMLGTRQLGRVFEVAKRINARILLSGDLRQHGAVERGEPFALLDRFAGLKPISVKRVMRQKGIYREAVEALSAGRVMDGYERLNKLNAIVELDGRNRYQALAKEYTHALDNGRSVLAVSPTHAESAKVNAAVRTSLQKTGHIDKEEHAVTVNRTLQWTKAQKQVSNIYQPGHRVFFHKPAPGIKAGARMQVDKADAKSVRVQAKDGKQHTLPLKHADRFSVYERVDLPLAKGELVRITQNTKTQDGKKLNNGSLYQVHDVSDDGTVRLMPRKAGRRTKPITLNSDALHLAYGYCGTSHASQGKTVDRVLVAQASTSGKAASTEQFYVSISRAREEVRVFTDDKHALLRHVHKSSLGLSATGLAAEGKLKPRPRNRHRGIAWTHHLQRVRRLKLWRQRTAERIRQKMKPRTRLKPRTPQRGLGHERER